MARYAEGTTVSVEKSQSEIHVLIAKYGAKRFASGYDEDLRLAVIQFEAHDRRVLFRLHLPDPADREFTHTPKGARRTDLQRQTAHEAEVRRLWRSLLLVIKAKLDSVASGIESFDEAFLPQVVVPGTGLTYAQFAVPQIDVAYERGELPPMLPGVTPSDIRALGDGRR